MREILRSAWNRWKRIAEVIGHFQAKLIFTLLYIVVAGPFAIGLRLFADPLEIRRRPRETGWRTIARQTTTLDAARRQF